MPTYHILYNPLAGNGTGHAKAESLKEVFTEGVLSFHDITKLDINKFISETADDDKIVISGGDGTLSRFINTIYDNLPEKEIYYHAAGSGNDFANDITLKKNGVCLLNPYLNRLPVTYVKGEKDRFINGVGYGIDGYCCQIGDELKKIPGKKVNYTGIAIKGLLFHFEPRNAEVTVDGKEYTYEKVWIAPTMHGKYYGGGMIPTPKQDRTSRNLSVMLFHGAGRLRTLCVFPSIFKGAHVKHTKIVALHTGHEITVEFDRPTPLQIDGETILDVTSYTASTAECTATKEA